MVTYENECVSCENSMGCLGSACPNRRVPHLYCDKCKKSVDELYHYNDEEWCIDCIKKDLGEVEIDE